MEDESRLNDLIDAYLDGSASAEQRTELDAALAADPRGADRFVAAARLDSLLEDHFDQQRRAERLAAICAKLNRPREETESAGGDLSIRPRLPLVGVVHGAIDFARRMPMAALSACLIAAALVAALATFVATRARPAPVEVARIVAVHDCQWGKAAAAANRGDRLNAGRELELLSGLAEIDFDCGARVIVEGPATFRITTDNAGRLARGKLRAKVPPSAAGFAVETPWARVVDLGTEFGVDSSGDRGEVHVFAGAVSVRPAKSRGAAPVSLRESQAIRVDAAGGIAALAARPERFVARMPGERFPIASTGMGVGIGQTDPHWQIAAVSTDSRFRPRPAVVCGQYGDRESDPKRAQWISIDAQPAMFPPGCRWTLSTTFDLTGYDPATARIAGRFSVDDFIVGLRLNGRRLPLPPGAHAAEAYVKKAPVTIDSGFVAGENTLEVDIENATVGVGDSAMAIWIQWDGTAQREEIP